MPGSSSSAGAIDRIRGTNRCFELVTLIGELGDSRGGAAQSELRRRVFCVSGVVRTQPLTPLHELAEGSSPQLRAGQPAR